MSNFIEFCSGWIDAQHERCIDPTAWTTSIRFTIYQTNKSYAIQFEYGSGQSKSFGKPHPSIWSRSSPVYRKSIDSIMRYARSECMSMKSTHKILQVGYTAYVTIKEYEKGFSFGNADTKKTKGIFSKNSNNLEQGEL